MPLKGGKMPCVSEGVKYQYNTLKKQKMAADLQSVVVPASPVMKREVSNVFLFPGSMKSNLCGQSAQSRPLFETLIHFNMKHTSKEKRREEKRREEKRREEKRREEKRREEKRREEKRREEKRREEKRREERRIEITLLLWEWRRDEVGTCPSPISSSVPLSVVSASPDLASCVPRGSSFVLPQYVADPQPETNTWAKVTFSISQDKQVHFKSFDARIH